MGIFYFIRKGVCVTGAANTFPVAGKGLILIKNETGLLPVRHAAAYEEGIVYDPDETGPMPFEAWKLKLEGQGWEIERIEPYPSKEEK